jgi:hypothetical protein
MAKITLPIATWVCVNQGAAYASGVEVTLNIERTTASLRYEFRNSDTVAPTQASDITEAVQSLSVKAVDGKGFLWLISQSVAVEVQIETITPAFGAVTFPTGMASEPKQDDQIAEAQAQTAELQAIKAAVEKTSATSAVKTPVLGTFNAVGVSAVFEPIAGRDFNIEVIFGVGVTGNVQLEQSLDGTNFYPLTGSGVAIMRFSSNSVEQWSNNEVGTKFRLSCTAIAGGTINYRISQ